MKVKLWGNLTILSSLILLFAGCGSDDDNEQKDFLTGTWTITVAEGTEWEEGLGVITPKADDPSSIGTIFTFAGGSLSVNDLSTTSSWQVEYTTTNLTMTTSNSPIYILDFEIKNRTANSMEWQQREPNKHSDYSDNGNGKFLYYQKFWTMVKQ